MFLREPCLHRDVSVRNKTFWVSLEKRIVIIVYASMQNTIKLYKHMFVRFAHHACKHIYIFACLFQRFKMQNFIVRFNHHIKNGNFNICVDILRLAGTCFFWYLLRLSDYHA